MPITEINVTFCFVEDPCGEIRGEPQSVLSDWRDEIHGYVITKRT